MPERKSGRKPASAAASNGGRGQRTGAGKTAGRAKTASPAKAASAAKAAKAASPAKAASRAKAVSPAKAVGPARAGRTAPAAPRLDVRKTYKLFVGGAFPRSESGRSYPVTGPDGALLAHAALASRKDARDAVSAARKALPGWSGATAYNRGQVLYRVAELLEGRAEQFAAECVKAAGVSPGEAESVVAGAIDRWVWYAGWPDKIGQVDGAANPVAGPYFNLSVPEPTGVVALLAPPEASLLALVSVLAPAIATGNSVVLVASETAPLAAISLAEVLATSDVPGGVVNVLTGRSAELAPVLAAHMDVNAIDLTGAAPADRAGLERLAAGNVKRVYAAGAGWVAEDWAATPGLARMLAFLETKTVWHPIGT